MVKERVQKELSFKEKLKLVFDDDLRTKSPEWKNTIDYVIIGLIIVSTLGVFLSTFSSLKEYNFVLDIIEVVTVVCFTIEIALRIWTADLLDERYKGFWGRIRYCFSFYGFLDLIAVVPFYINLFLPTPSSAFRIMRVFRFMRLFNYMKSSRLLLNAISSKKSELTITLSFLTLLTVVLSVLLYFVEHEAQPDQCENGWQTFVWAFAKYLGDPGKIADFTLQTPAANLIAFIVGLLGIAIFAVPTGIISSGITEALEDDKREKELEGFRYRMKKDFCRSFDKGLREYLNTLPDGGGEDFKTLNIVPQRVPIAKMQVKQGMDVKDIIDTCNKFDEFRLKNLADAHSAEDDAEDRFVVEHFPLNRNYGCCIPRDSKVTIVCTTGADEVGISWFTYYLAKMGGFNYISKELSVDPDETDSFYNLSDEPLYDKKPISDYDKKKDKEAVEILNKKQAHRDEFFADLKKVVADGSWVIIITEHLKTKDNQTDFHFADCLKDGSSSTVNDQNAFMRLFEQFTETMKIDFSLTSTLRSPRYPLLKGNLKKNLGYKIREKKPNANVFVLRPSSELMNFNDRKLAVAYRMACIISQQLDGGRGIQPKDVKDFEETGFGYGKIEELNIEDGTTETTL